MLSQNSVKYCGAFKTNRHASPYAKRQKQNHAAVAKHSKQENTEAVQNLQEKHKRTRQTCRTKTKDKKGAWTRIIDRDWPHERRQSPTQPNHGKNKWMFATESGAPVRTQNRPLTTPPTSSNHAVVYICDSKFHDMLWSPHRGIRLHNNLNMLSVCIREAWFATPNGPLRREL